MPQTLVRHDHVSRLDIHPGRLELTHPVPFQALCEQHLLPFYGVVRVGYVRGENRLLQTEFIRIVESCSAAVQVQQKMTTRIGLWLHHQLAAPGMGVLVEAGYACTPVRDGAALAGPTTTMAFYGSMRDSAEEQREFLTLARSRGMDRPE